MKSFGRELKERNVLENVGRIILKIHVKEGVRSMNWIDLAVDRVKWRDEPLRSVPCEEFLDQPRKYWLLTSVAWNFTVLCSVLSGSVLARAAFDLHVYSQHVNNMEFSEVKSYPKYP